MVGFYTHHFFYLTLQKKYVIIIIVNKRKEDRMEFSIIITCDMDIINEKPLYQLLCSINNQVGFSQDNVEIRLLYNNPKAKFNFTNYPIFNKLVKLYCKKNSTIGNMKEEGYSNSLGKYILFLDKNIIFYHNTALSEIQSLLRSKKDYYILNCVSGYVFNGLDFKLEDGIKIYNKEFLMSNNLHFPNVKSDEEVIFTQKIMNINAQWYKEENAIYFIQLENKVPKTVNAIYNNIMANAYGFCEVAMINKNRLLNNLSWFIQSMYELENQFNLDEADRKVIEKSVKDILDAYKNIYTPVYGFAAARPQDPEFENFCKRVMEEENE